MAVAPPTFELATAARIVFGAGARAEIAPAVAALGAKSVVLVTGRSPARADEILRSLRHGGISVARFVVAGEPTVELVRSGVRAVAEAGGDAVVAVGGGSALDAGKAISAMATAEGDVMEHLEVVGAGRPLKATPLPFIAAPTTAGTGSEVTKNAVLTAPEARVKASLRSPLMLPRVAVVDPDLLQGVPPPTLVSSGLDALSQLIEPFLSLRANPITDALAREAIPRSIRALPAAFRTGIDGQHTAPVREDLAFASLCGGLCLANAGLGAVHGFAAPLGGMFDAPHGAVCAALLPHVLAVNLRALRSRAAGHPAVERYRELARLITGQRDVDGEDAVRAVEQLCRDLAVPSLRSSGMTEGDVPDLVGKAQRASSMKGNPIPLTDAELTEIATRAL